MVSSWGGGGLSAFRPPSLLRCAASRGPELHVLSFSPHQVLIEYFYPKLILKAGNSVKICSKKKAFAIHAGELL